MAEGRAQHWFKQFVDSTGTPVQGVKVYHYAAGTTNDQDIWHDAGKTTTHSQPYTGDPSGMASFYADGDYRLLITDANDNTLWDFDNVRITADQATAWEGSHGTSLPGADALNKWHLYTRHSASDGFQGVAISDGTAYRDVTASLNAGVFNVKDPYGAVGDRVTDDTAAIQAAFDAVSVPQTAGDPSGSEVGGKVVFPGGTYRISSPITVPNLVSVEGLGQVVIITDTTDLAKMFSVDSTEGFGNRYGTIENIFFDGNNKAKVGLYAGMAVQRTFKTVSATRCTDVGCVVDGSQNNRFVDCNWEGNGASGSTFGAGIRVNHGAGNNLFARNELSANIPYQLVICDNDTVDDATKDTGTFPAGPSSNVFVESIFERGDVTSGVNQIYIRAGRSNEFYSPEISFSGQTSAKTGVRVTMEDRGIKGAPVSTAHTKFIGGQYAGTSTMVTGFETVRLSSGVGHTLYVDGMFFENLLTAFTADADTRIAIGPSNDIGASNTNRYSGSGAIDTVTWSMKVHHKIRGIRDLASEFVLTAEVDGDSQARFRALANGALEWAAGTDDSLNKPTLQRVVYGGTNHAAMRFSDPLSVQGTAAGLYSGSGTPEGTVFANNGSVYLDTDGLIWVKQSGGFTATGWSSK